MANQISAGTLDAPSWDVIQTAKVAARIYAPLGTNMTLGDHVRVIQTFVEGFKKTGKGWSQTRERSGSWDEPTGPLLGENDKTQGVLSTQTNRSETVRKRDEDVDTLAKDLMVSSLSLWFKIIVNTAVLMVRLIILDWCN